MGFIQHCFIRKNTPELQAQLKKIGLHHNCFDDNTGDWLAVNYGIFISVSKGFEKLHPKDIDCELNEDLFLALAALNNSTDRNQWFICQSDYLSHGLKPINKGEWQLNTQYEKLCYGLGLKWKKATVEEIINHFR